MTLEVLSFGFGGLLIATAIIGGGFEIKEIRMPQVNAGVRLVSLVVGSGFVLLGLGVWGLERPHLLVPQTQSGSFVPERPELAPEQAQAQVQTGAGQGSTATADWDYPAATGGAPFGGLSGRARLRWAIADVAVEAVAEMNGQSGVIRVGYNDPRTGQYQEVDQDLVLQQTPELTYYQGMNPRYAGTAVPHPTYAPDAFRLAHMRDNLWTIDQICDAYVCAPVSTEPLPE